MYVEVKLFMLERKSSEAFLQHEVLKTILSILARAADIGVRVNRISGTV
jgi:hypothetical protein